MAISLNIYDPKDKKKVVKVHEVEGYDLMLGTIEDFMDIFDMDKLDDDKEVAKMVIKSYKQLKPLIMDIFPELTSEELKNIKVAELIRIVPQIGSSIMESLNRVKNSKNLERA